MPRTINDQPSATIDSDFTIVKFDAMNATHAVHERVWMATPDLTTPDNVRVMLPRQDAFAAQKAAFEQLPLSALTQYSGQYVIAINGRIVDSDINLPVLAKRFAKEYGNADAYVTRINADRTPLIIPTPFLR